VVGVAIALDMPGQLLKEAIHVPPMAIPNASVQNEDRFTRGVVGFILFELFWDGLFYPSISSARHILL